MPISTIFNFGGVFEKGKCWSIPLTPGYEYEKPTYKKAKKIIKNKSNIIIAYEPVWSIGTGVIPKESDLNKTISFIKSRFIKKYPKILYGGSVNTNNVSILKKIPNIDGFLIGGASQIPKKFIDIIQKTIN